MFCRICGEDKEKSEFVRIKHFKRIIPEKRDWCRDCMRMYVEMKKQQEQKEELKTKLWLFTVKFD